MDRSAPVSASIPIRHLWGGTPRVGCRYTRAPMEVNVAQRQRTRAVPLTASMVTVCVVAALLTVATTVESAQAVTCTSTITGTVGSVVVPSGATCIATNLVVNGDLTIQNGATFQSWEPGQ